MKLSRRETLGLAGGALALGLAPARAATPSLAQAARDAGLVFGTAIAQDTLDSPAQAQLYLAQSGIFTVDYAMNLGALRPTATTFDPGEANAILAFARAAAIPVRGHALAWNESRPDWLMRLSTAEKRKALDRHIDETAAYFAGQLQSWDVVNEPFWPGHGLKGGFRDGPWYQAFGEGYAVRAFRRAAAADPAAKLVLNEALAEAWTDTGATIRAGLLKLVDTLQQAGVRLDAVGFQAHLLPQKPYDDNAFTVFLHQIAEKKVEIYLTEMDVDDTAFPDDIGARDAAVAARYHDFLAAVLTVPAVTIVETWQLADSASWYYKAALQDDPNARKPRPLPFDEALRDKPAVAGIRAAFAGRKP